jgi:hypothetical protein
MSQSSEERMFTLIRQWQGSGMGQKDFCQKKGIAYSSFHYWYKKFRMSEPVERELSFVPVPLPVSMASIFCTVHMPGGVSIDFHQPVPVGYLSQISG